MIQHIETETRGRAPQSPGRGEAAEIVGPAACGAKNVRGLLRWLGPGERLEASPLPASRQLLYLMEGEAVVELGGKEHRAGPGAGLYLGPGEGAALRPAGGATLKMLHLTVPPA